MISRRAFIRGLTLTAAGLLIPETVGRVFDSSPKVVVPQNLGEATYYWWKHRDMGMTRINTAMMQAMFDKVHAVCPHPKAMYFGGEWRKI